MGRALIMSDVIASAGTSEAARALFWEVFFFSRGRGVSLQVHFPWLENDQEVTCLEIRDPSNLESAIAALIIRAIELPNGEPVGLIGLVCVHEEWRGAGLSVELMSAAMDHAMHNGLSALVLWTQKPGIYERHGFRFDEQESTGSIYLTNKCAVDIEYVTSDWPGSDTHDRERGLPPFALYGQRIKSEGAELILLGGADRVTLAEWQGEDSQVASLIQVVMAEPWIINVCAQSTLMAELTKRGFKVDLVPGAVRMIKWLTNRPSTVHPIKLIDRI